MKRNILTALTFAMLLGTCAMYASAQEAEATATAEGYDGVVYDDQLYFWKPDYEDYDENGVWVHDTMEVEHPHLVVFPNMQDDSLLTLDDTSEDGIQSYLQETGLIDFASDIIAEIVVVIPQEDMWSEADVDAAVYAEYYTAQTLQQHTYDWAYMTNVRLIGFGDGAAFVGDCMTDYEEIRRVAGVFMYGGDMSSVPEDGLVVTAYLSNGLDNAEEYFANVIEADSELEQDGVDVKYNSTYYNDILRVGIGPEGESTSEALYNAWNTVFQYQYRYYLNSEPYGPRDDTNTRTFYYEDRARYDQPAYFQPAFVPGEDVVETTTVTNQIGDYSSELPYMYYVYTPADKEDTEGMALVVSFAGSTNDPRYVAMINGWIDQVGKGEYILLVPKHLGNAEYETMTGPVLEALILQICDEYGIDMERIYATSYGNVEIEDENGFAYNGMISAELAYMYPELIASYASSISLAGVYCPDGLIEELNAEGMKVNGMVWCGDNDMYGSLPLPPEKVWNDIAPLFSTGTRVIDGMPALLNDDADWENDPYYGIPDCSAKGTIEEPEGYTLIWETEADPDGVDRLMFCVAQGMSHQGCASFATIAWENWFSNITNSNQ